MISLGVILVFLVVAVGIGRYKNRTKRKKPTQYHEMNYD